MVDFASSSPSGIDDVINRLNQQHRDCPNQKFALVGYSQGAIIMHGVFGSTNYSYPGGPKVRPKLQPEVIPKILALAMFGDPQFQLSSIFPVFERENCAPRNLVC
jgi:cutinase